MATAYSKSGREIFDSSDGWRDLANRVQLADARWPILVIGGVDTGKSTLVSYLQRVLGEHERVARIDADVGQSVIGPPGTVALTYPPEKEAADRSSDVCRFVGDISPSGNLLQVLTAVVSLVKRARGDRIVVDTSGFVYGRAAEEFKYHLIEMVKPAVVVAIEKEQHELNTLLHPFRKDPGVNIHRIAADAENLRQKTRAERGNYRIEAFQSYFKHAQNVELDLTSRAVHGFAPHGQDACEEGRVIGLLDNNHDMLTLALERKYDPESETLLCLTPRVETARITNIQYGKLVLKEF